MDSMVCLCGQQVAKGREGSSSRILETQRFFHWFLIKTDVRHRAMWGNPWVMTAFGGFHPFDLESEDSSCRKDIV